ncbi:SGNH/GDSL hydrolase family protein [Ornithinibacillus xuwenensis]|uniref:GDSL-type esterase/lipase family protein n=1 Tax=Ornithinibacillus xuwenensis TaxID=3144668 RepID=A0ABU9XK64_9BACI
MRVLFIGDSLGLPRPHRINKYAPNEKELAVAYEETYSSIINMELVRKYNLNPYVEVINRCKRFYTIKNVYEEFSDHLFFFEPDVIVMQVGIVDCWFREELKGKQLVSKDNYEIYLKNILTLLEHRPNCRLIIIGIAPTSTKMEDRFNGINQEIATYNTILKSKINNKNVFYVDMEKYIKPDSVHEYLLPDDHHLNKYGNKLLAELIQDILIAFIESDKGVGFFNQEQYKNALDSFQVSLQRYPYYLDNVYNTLVLAYQLKEQDILEKIVSYIKEFQLKDERILEFLNMVRGR